MLKVYIYILSDISYFLVLILINSRNSRPDPTVLFSMKFNQFQIAPANFHSFSLLQRKKNSSANPDIYAPVCVALPAGVSGVGKSISILHIILIIYNNN